MRNRKTVEQVLKKQNTTVTCDSCGVESPDDDNWTNGRFDYERTTIRYDKGSDYPEGRYGTILHYDLCPKCFQEILFPFLKERLGKEPNETDADDWY